MYVCIYICIHTYRLLLQAGQLAEPAQQPVGRHLRPLRVEEADDNVGLLLRTNGVNTNGAAAKVIKFDGSTQKVPVNNMKVAVTPLVLTPFVPFRGLPRQPGEGRPVRGLARRLCLDCLFLMLYNLSGSLLYHII